MIKNANSSPPVLFSASGNIHRHTQTAGYALSKLLDSFWTAGYEMIMENFFAAAYYKMDLTPRKASLKLMIQEELTKLAEEDEEDEDEDDDDAEKEGKPVSKGKAVEAWSAQKDLTNMVLNLLSLCSHL